MSEVTESARLRLLHAAVGFASVDVHLDQVPLVDDLPFGASTDHLPISPGGHSVAVLSPDARSTGQEVLSGKLEDVRPGQEYTLALLGRKPDVHADVLEDSAPVPAADQAKVRFLHAVPDAPAVDVAVGGMVLFSNVRFRDATGFVEVAAGTVDLQVRPTGSAKTIVELPGFVLSAGSLYTFVALGLLRGRPALTVMPLVTIGELFVSV